MNKERTRLVQSVININEHNFEEVALDVFQYQAKNNPIYRQYITLLGKSWQDFNCVEEIPFLPIELYKSHSIQTGEFEPQVVFTSSGTTGAQTSRQFVRDLAFYERISQAGFESFYGKLEDYCVLALLPAYLERKGSSLVYMANHFIAQSKYDDSGFFLDDLAGLSQILQQNQSEGIPTLLLGVSFALLDLAEQFPQDLSNIIIMETGGMKGRRKELTRGELHGILRNEFQVKDIHSEYGMTELLSQAYSKEQGIFYPISTMKIVIKEINDPFCNQIHGKTGILNVIDLANIDSCAFIATQDLGKCYKDGSFEVLGRLDYSMMRGCNLMLLDR